MESQPGEPQAQQAVTPDSPAAPAAQRVRPWMINLGCVALGALIGALLFAAFVTPRLGEPSRFKAMPGYDPTAPEEALVAVAASGLRAAPGEWITVAWVVTNTGESSWPVDLYYFAPQTTDLPVISLPESVSPGEEVVVQARVEVPLQPAGWEPAWRLKGRRGFVPGGTLRIRVSTTGV